MFMKKIRLILPSKKATPGPPIGPMLGQHGLPIDQFCKQFNQQTMVFKEGIPIRILLFVGKNRTFTFAVSIPSVSYFLLKSLRKVEDESFITLKQVYEIAVIYKNIGRAPFSLEAICNMILGTAKAMQISIVDDLV